MIITATSVSWACRGVSAAPTRPSVMIVAPAIASAPAGLAQEFPSLTGRWRASGTTAFRNLDTGNMRNTGSCSGAFTIETQEAGQFAGPLSTQGSGWNSDRFCTASGTFTGELVERDGSVARAELDGSFQNWPRPSVSPSCEMLAAGDGIWTGSAMSDEIRLQVRDSLRCPANVDGGIIAAPMANFERTVTLVFQRW